MSKVKPLEWNLLDSKKKSRFSDSEQVLKNIKTKNEVYWNKRQEDNSLEIFHMASTRVPAYKKFLKQNNIKPESIKTIEDFKKIPPINKDNYLRKHSLDDLCVDGSLSRPLVFTSTSGSTGEPFYFCRSSFIDWQSSIIHESFFNNLTTKPNASTLVIVCFGMGVWIGGIITYQAFELIGQRGNPVSIITPGINKDEIFKALKQLAPQFDQVIIAAYPPFMKDILDEAEQSGIKLKDLNIKLLFAAEAFTEKFRDYMTKKVGIKNPYRDTMNIYGSADIGSMAFETPLSIFIRRTAMKKPRLYAKIFGTIGSTPTLAQYVPDFINFESHNGEVLLTSNNNLPLIRYSIGDYGNVFDYAFFKKMFAEEGLDLELELEKNDIKPFMTKLPFVAIYERLDFSTKLYGAIIRPEPIREVLQDEMFAHTLTGKFSMITKLDEKMDQYLEINVELGKEAVDSKALTQNVQNLIVKNLTEKNAEFRNNYSMIPEKVAPRIKFWPHEDPTYFRSGIKQKWVRAS